MGVHHEIQIICLRVSYVLINSDGLHTCDKRSQLQSCQALPSVSRVNFQPQTGDFLNTRYY
ncbi:hypothetical protein NIES2107_36310 [Nostoc carneum NIES-2107]|nr:hypothetical protein NIES2107_36310 [Nostoc carneum NIES-2107]